MNRLTERIKGIQSLGWGGGVFIKKTTENCMGSFCKNAKKCEHIETRSCPYLKMVDKLANYEDLEEIKHCNNCDKHFTNGGMCNSTIQDVGQIDYCSKFEIVEE
jgi:hypothetical protein